MQGDSSVSGVDCLNVSSVPFFGDYVLSCDLGLKVGIHLVVFLVLIHSIWVHPDLSHLVVVILLAVSLLIPICSVWVCLAFRVLIRSEELWFGLVRLSED